MPCNLVFKGFYKIGLEKSLAARLKRDSPLAEQLKPLISQGWYLRRAVCASDRDGCTEAPSEQSRGLRREGSHGNCSKSTGKRHFLSWAVYHDSFWWHCLPKYYQIISNPSLGVWLPPGAKMWLLLLGELYCSKLFLLFPQVWEERC